jgi:bis(5'-nucleosyl)-tetraphosphatase (symmetrical)
VPRAQALKAKIVFGHWATLNGQTHKADVFATDTGCSWGYALTALRLEDLRYFHVAATIKMRN